MNVASIANARYCIVEALHKSRDPRTISTKYLISVILLFFHLKFALIFYFIGVVWLPLNSSSMLSLTLFSLVIFSLSIPVFYSLSYAEHASSYDFFGLFFWAVRQEQHKKRHRIAVSSFWKFHVFWEMNDWPISSSAFLKM